MEDEIFIIRIRMRKIRKHSNKDNLQNTVFFQNNYKYQYNYATMIQ